MRRFSVAAVMLCMGAPAIAAYTLQFTESGGDVVATGSGSLNPAALTLVISGGYNAMVEGSTGIALAGPAGGTAMDGYQAIDGPNSIGAGNTFFFADTGSGDKVGVQGAPRLLVVPSGYVAGAPLASTTTWNAATFASLGLTPGEYIWTWGTGANADSFTLRIGLMQAITFTSAAPGAAVVGGAAYNVAATGGASGNPVVFSIDPSAAAVCSVAGTVVSFNGAGTCVINANQAGGGGYAPAPQVQQSFVVAATPPPAASIPTLTEWGLVGISSLMVLFGLARLRRNKSALK